jgi:hypothetical protein
MSAAVTLEDISVKYRGAHEYAIMRQHVVQFDVNGEFDADLD